MKTLKVYSTKFTNLLRFFLIQSEGQSKLVGVEQSNS